MGKESRLFCEPRNKIRTRRLLEGSRLSLVKGYQSYDSVSHMRAIVANALYETFICRYHHGERLLYLALNWIKACALYVLFSIGDSNKADTKIYTLSRTVTANIIRVNIRSGAYVRRSCSSKRVSNTRRALDPGAASFT